MATKNKTAGKTPEQKIVVTRRFDAPAELVFDAWLDPKVAGRWLFATPDGEMKKVEIDARVGGTFTIAEKRGDEIVEHVGKYLEIERPRRLAFNFSVPKYSKAVTTVAVDIVAKGDGCEVTLTHTGVLPEWAERTTQGWTTLLANLDKTVKSAGEIVITRVFDAPRELVWQAWTEPKRLAQWWGPRGFTNPRCEVDVRPGGVIRIDMRGPNGALYPMSGVYQEIVAPERLVYTSGALDQEEKLIFEFHHTVVFEDQKGKTLMTMKTHLLNAAPAAAAYTGGFKAGMSQSLERLAKLIEK